MTWQRPAAAMAFILCAAGVLRPQTLSPALVDAITETFNQVDKLHPMPYGAEYTLMVGGKSITADPDYFLRRRTGAEILASGMSDGCGDNALAALYIMEKHGFQTYFVDSAQISRESLQNNFSGHAVIAVYDPKAGLWVRVDPTQRQYSFPWTTTDKAFYGNYWIGYRGPLAGYPAHDPESLKKFYRDTLNTIPPEVLNQTLFRLRFTVDPSMTRPDGRYRNPNLDRFLRDNGKILEAHGVHPNFEIPIRLMNGRDDAESRCGYVDGWTCSIGEKSAVSLGFTTYLEECLNTAREKGEPLGAIPAPAETGAPPNRAWLGWVIFGIIAAIVVAALIWQRRRLAGLGIAFAYWACQILGWSGLFLMALASGRMDTSPRSLTTTSVFILFGILTTDLLRRHIRRRRWLTLPNRPMLLRLSLAVLIVSAIQFCLVEASDFAFHLFAGTPFDNLLESLQALLFTAVMTALWTFFYVLLTGPRRHREMEVQLQLALREAELRALEAQINPHFLFNCLNSIRALVTENPARSQDMLTRLANILRYNLHSDLEHTVPLHSEVEIVSDYLAIESARYDDRLRVEMAIDPAAADAPVPPMLLQSLVENALKHGIAPRLSGGELLIRAKVVGDATLMEVENPGEIAPVIETTQLGLANIRERLRILYNGRASFELKSRDGRVAASVLIPRTA